MTRTNDASLSRQEVEDRFDLLIADVREYAIFVVAPDGTIMSWNPGAERLLGFQLFSSSNFASRTASSAFIPPYWLRQRAYVLSLTSSACSTAAKSLAELSIASASRSFLTTCSGLCRFLRPVVIKVSLPNGHLNLHNIWIRFSTAGHPQRFGHREGDRLTTSVIGP